MIRLKNGIVLDNDIQEVYECDKCEFPLGYRYVDNNGKVIQDDFKSSMHLYNYCPHCGEPLKY